MSLLLKALQNAARNREAAGTTPTEPTPDGGVPAAGTGPDELSLEPVQPSPRAAARTQAPSSDAAGERQRHAAPGPQQAQNVLRAGARPQRMPRQEPGILDWLSRRPLVAFSTAAGLFAIGYGVYLYLQLTNPGMFIAQTSPPPAPPKSTAAPPSQPQAPPPAPPAVASAPAPSALTPPAPPSPPSARGDPPLPGTPASGASAVAPPAIAAPSVAPTPSPPASPALSSQSSAGSRAAPEPAPRERAAPPRTAAPPAMAPVPAAPRSAGATPPTGAIAAAPPVPAGPAAGAIASGGTIAPAERAAARPRPPTQAPAATRELPEGVAPAGATQVVAVDRNVLNAYQALEQGRLDDAEHGYRQALSSDARNVDAMLGLAATLGQKHQGEAASQLYLRVLEQDPRNTHAQAGLLNIAGRADPGAAEARLKQLIAREPTAFLYFTLGNLYSERGQWAAAQSAYFQAHSLAPDNPDYAFNLAVGLEHLSQPRIALDYYRRAVALAQSRGHAQFELARVENRIRSLEATLAGRP